MIRHYHGHLSGVYSMALHPSLDVLMTGGRDSVCRVWDMRSKTQAFCLTGHDNTVCSIISQEADPQVRACDGDGWERSASSPFLSCESEGLGATEHGPWMMDTSQELAG